MQNKNAINMPEYTRIRKTTHRCIFKFSILLHYITCIFMQPPTLLMNWRWYKRYYTNFHCDPEYPLYDKIHFIFAGTLARESVWTNQEPAYQCHGARAMPMCFKIKQTLVGMQLNHLNLLKDFKFLIQRQNEKEIFEFWKSALSNQHISKARLWDSGMQDFV